MTKKILFGLLIFVCGGTILVVLFFKYKNNHTGIALLCGDARISLSKNFMALKKPTDIPQLDGYGCYANSSGCACAKIDSMGQGIVFGLSSSNNIGIPIPADTDGQKKLLTSLGELMIANAKASTTVTHSQGMFKQLPSMTITTVLDNGSTTPTSRDFFLIRNGTLYDLTFETSNRAFLAYWPDIEESLKTLVFVK